MTGPDTTLACQHCGALYSILVVHLATAELSSVECQHCNKVMASSRGTARPVFRLIRRPVAASLH